MKARIGPNAVQRKIMDSEIKKRIAEFDRKNAAELDAIILWVLHEQLGFGAKRLRRFYDRFADEVAALVNKYETDDCDDAWLCTQKLKEIGVDIEEWSKENA